MAKNKAKEWLDILSKVHASGSVTMRHEGKYLLTHINSGKFPKDVDFWEFFTGITKHDNVLNP